MCYSTIPICKFISSNLFKKKNKRFSLQFLSADFRFSFIFVRVIKLGCFDYRSRNTAMFHANQSSNNEHTNSKILLVFFKFLSSEYFINYITRKKIDSYILDIMDFLRHQVHSITIKRST